MTERRKIETFPPKSFFVRTLVRDIDLLDSILDLIDNSIDSYIKKNLSGRKTVSITLSDRSFVIEDDCGGIEKESIYEHVLRFGDLSESKGKTIGVYGIGMKRAIFKIGQNIVIESDDGKDFYAILIDKEWISNNKKWDLDFKTETSSKGTPLTKITITEFYPNIAEEIKSVVFHNRLKEKIRDAYSIFIEDAITIKVNNESVAPYEFKFLCDSINFAPLNKKSKYDGVEVEIYAGFTATESEDKTYGWNIFCNNRLIVKNDTTYRTGWGGGDRSYHYPQDDRFLGLVFFSSDNPMLLPWQTTKTDIEYDSRLYRAVQTDMQAITYKFQSVLRWAWRVRDADTKETLGKSLFEKIPLVSRKRIKKNQSETLPEIRQQGRLITVTSISEYTTISYSKKKVIVNKLKKKLGNSYMSNRALGEKTFDYFAKLEEID